MGESLIIRSSGGIDTSAATASASHILVGYTAYANDIKLSGTMVNNGQQSVNIGPGGSKTISEGYHDGTGVISVSSLSSNTSGTAQAGWILSAYIAWVNGNKLTGTMNNRGSQSWNLAANGSQIIWSGYYDGTGKVNQSLTTSSGGTWTPTTSNKTLAAASTWVSEAWYVAGASTLIAANIKKGISIFGVTGTFVGYVSGKLYIIQNGVLQYGKITLQESYGGSYVNHDTDYGVQHPTTVNGAFRIYNWQKYVSRNRHKDQWLLEFRLPPWNSTKTLYIWYDYSVYVWSDNWGGDSKTVTNILRVDGAIYWSTFSDTEPGKRHYSDVSAEAVNGDSETGCVLYSMSGSSGKWCDTKDASMLSFSYTDDKETYTTRGYIDIKNMWITLE